MAHGTGLSGFHHSAFEYLTGPPIVNMPERPSSEGTPDTPFEYVALPIPLAHGLAFSVAVHDSHPEVVSRLPMAPAKHTQLSATVTSSRTRTCFNFKPNAPIEGVFAISSTATAALNLRNPLRTRNAKRL